MENRTDTIEPGIRPLVDALNRSGIVRTFSSCEGHYGSTSPSHRHRQQADVRFLPAPNQTPQTVEEFMSQLLIRFRDWHGIMPIQLIGYKLFTPTGDGQIDTTFVLELRPFLPLDPPATQRADTDRAVKQVARLLDSPSER